MSLFHIPVMLRLVKLGTQEGGLLLQRLGAMMAPQNKTNPEGGENPHCTSFRGAWAG
jgi:hypothetical protein